MCLSKQIWKKVNIGKKIKLLLNLQQHQKKQINIDFSKIKLTMHKMTQRKLQAKQRRANDNDEKSPENEDISRSDPLWDDNCLSYDTDLLF